MIHLNRRRLTLRFFPNGELNAPATLAEFLWGRYDYPTEATLMWESDADLIHLMLLKAACPTLTDLYISFMPYGREDRGTGNSICSLRFIGQMIQQMGWSKIEVLDPHSDATLAYLGVNASEWEGQHRSFRGYIKEHMDDPETVILFPDAGAQKRYAKLWGEYTQCVGFKNRDMQTGKILSYSVANPQVVMDRPVLIVDDLCSYGGTFVMAADALQEYSPAKVDLAVTHCEVNAFNEKLFSKIGTLYTTNSLLRAVPEAYKTRVNFFDYIF